MEIEFVIFMFAPKLVLFKNLSIWKDSWLIANSQSSYIFLLSTLMHENQVLESNQMRKCWWYLEDGSGWTQDWQHFVDVSGEWGDCLELFLAI